MAKYVISKLNKNGDKIFAKVMNPNCQIFSSTGYLQFNTYDSARIALTQCGTRGKIEYAPADISTKKAVEYKNPASSIVGIDELHSDNSANIDLLVPSELQPTAPIFEPSLNPRITLHMLAKCHYEMGCLETGDMGDIPESFS